MLAAFQRVAEIGFEGLRLRQVAEQVGIDHSTLHHHFTTKQALVVAVAEHTTRQFWSTAPSAAEPATGLREHLDALRKLMAARPDLMVVCAELDLRARRDPDVAAAMAGFERGWREVLTGLLGADGRAAEFVIATVKGVRLAPELAGPVFDRLAALTDTEEERP